MLLDGSRGFHISDKTVSVFHEFRKQRGLVS
jgi:hypothetical protein